MTKKPILIEYFLNGLISVKFVIGSMKIKLLININMVEKKFYFNFFVLLAETCRYREIVIIFKLYSAKS